MVVEENRIEEKVIKEKNMPLLSKKKRNYRTIEIAGKLGELVVEDTTQDIVKNTSNVITSNQNNTKQLSTTQNTVHGNSKSSSIETTNNINERKGND